MPIIPHADRSHSNTPSDGTTLLLSRQQVATLIDLDDCIGAVEAALLAHAEGRTIPPGVLGVPVEGGGFHIKTAGLTSAPPYFAAKLNANYDANYERFGLPRIQGLIVLNDAVTGFPLAVMDSVEITALRTAAATAVAARYLANTESAVATICGCGLQGRMHLEALSRVRPLKEVYAFDHDFETARRLAAKARDELGVAARATRNLSHAASRSTLIVTATPSRAPLLGPDDVRPGAFVAAVGADSEIKQELEPELLAAAAVVVDHLEQCATIGELHHALGKGLLKQTDVRGELHEVVAGHLIGRQSVEEIIVFDSTGIAIEDVAAASLAFERARDRGVGIAARLL